jgi:hypothetical protein
MDKTKIILDTDMVMPRGVKFLKMFEYMQNLIFIGDG